MKTGILLVALANVMCFAAAARDPVPNIHVRPTFAGPAKAIDGDSLVIAGKNLRLWGIDAPELNQTCPDGFKAGARAYEHLASIVQGRTVSCRQLDLDHHRRPLVICSAAGYGELNAGMVEAGLAWAYRHYTPAYAALEDEAKAQGRWLWQHNCQPPWQHRLTNRRRQ
jgi:endonuclease YncB( thermonuclease family)